jgi:hypothetical protein
MLDLRQVKQAPDVLLQDLDGEAVLLNLANGQYYGLDETGFDMYKILVSSSSVQAAYDKLLQTYMVEPRQLQTDLEIFLKHLLDHGLIIYVDQ